MTVCRTPQVMSQQRPKARNSARWIKNNALSPVGFSADTSTYLVSPFGLDFFLHPSVRNERSCASSLRLYHEYSIAMIQPPGTDPWREAQYTCHSIQANSTDQAWPNTSILFKAASNDVQLTGSHSLGKEATKTNLTSLSLSPRNLDHGKRTISPR